MTEGTKKEKQTHFDVFNSRKEGEAESFFAKVFGKQQGHNKDDEEQDTKGADDDKSEQLVKDEGAKKLPAFLDSMFAKFGGGSKGDQDGAVRNDLDEMIMGARDFGKAASNEDTMKSSESSQEVDKLFEELKLVNSAMTNNFSHLNLDNLNPLALVYYLEHEDSLKTPSWKRRNHRFLPDIDRETVHEIHEFLYLAEASYLDTKEEIEEALAKFSGNASYELVYCCVEGLPREPANFIAIQKEPVKMKKDGGFLWFGGAQKRALQILLVVRGTKEFGDMISDLLLDTTEYREGVSHEGVTEAGKFVVNKHLELLQYMLKESGMDMLDITIVGHSLGAGAGAIAAIELKDLPNFNVKCIGFGCPALLDKEQSEKTKDFITTIVSDSDCVPRMSGATASNVIHRVMTYEWFPAAMLDLDQMLHVADCNLPVKIPEEQKQQIRDLAKSEYEKHVKPQIETTAKGSSQQEVVLFPPGRCIHAYRDGAGVSACEVPCDLFSELDVTRTMVDDHLTVSGYDKMLTELMRAHLHDSTFSFPNDVPGLRIEREVRLEKQTSR